MQHSWLSLVLNSLQFVLPSTNISYSWSYCIFCNTIDNKVMYIVKCKPLIIQVRFTWQTRMFGRLYTLMLNADQYPNSKIPVRRPSEACCLKTNRTLDIVCILSKFHAKHNEWKDYLSHSGYLFHNVGCSRIWHRNSFGVVGKISSVTMSIPLY